MFNKLLYVLFNVLLFIINLEFGYTYKWHLIFKTFSYWLQWIFIHIYYWSILYLFVLLLFYFSIFIYVYGLCIYICIYTHIFFLCVWPPMCVCFCMSMHACGVFRLMSRIIINSSSTLTTEAKSLIQTQNWPIWPITSKLALGNPLWGWNYRQPTTPIQIYPALGIWTLVLKLAWL